MNVIHQVVDVNDIKTVQVNGNERKKTEFELRDSNDDRMPCCLWDRLPDDGFALTIVESTNNEDALDFWEALEVLC
ncbi:unnamed protein product [Thlaspi arvense]|uniref:Uncharacterized protein n=1 Tax=Thlaspi arvense TaxID=13288 RepID=A0AAU9SK33_THLAR|nr:unnamed protein product [Thlaspi arvense]